MKTVHWLAGAALLGVAIQLVPVARSNPSVTREVDAPPEVRDLLRRACYDCHSHETKWPWYGYVAPVSWLLAHDVDEGRRELNFSTWDAYDEDEQVDNADRAIEEIEDGEMPPWFYLPLHPEAELSAEDLAVLRSWADER